MEEKKVIKINENITLTYLPMSKFKTTSTGVYIHRPLCEEEVSKNALLPYVLKRGCAAAPDSGAVARYLENLYGATFGAGVMKLGDDQIIYLGFETISDKYAPEGERLSAETARLMLSSLFEPAGFDESVVTQEKKNAADRILAEINDKRVYAQKRCVQEMFDGESYALSAYGTTDGIADITADILKAHYESIITESQIDIYVCGETDADALAADIKAYTDKLSFTAAPLPKSKLFARTGDIRRVTDRMEVTQGKLSLGFKTGIAPDSDEYFTLMVMNSVFGGGAHSKLFNNVREKLSLCYYASSSPVKNKGVMIVNAGIEFHNFEKAYNEILAQLDAVKNGDISELEYKSSIAFINNQFESYKDDERLMQIFLLGQRISGTDFDIDKIKEKVSAVTIDDIKRAAQKTELDTVYFLTGKEDA